MLALVVEPSRVYRSLVTAVLADNGFTAVEAEGFEEAADMTADRSYELICMAVVLQDGDSYELIARIRASGLNSSTPILLLTSVYSRETIEKAYALGVTDVFRKEDFTNFEYYLKQFSEQLRGELVVSGRILYVEDNRSVAAITQALLEDSGHEVSLFASGEGAWEAFMEDDFDLVLTDVLLEGELSGTSLVRRVRHVDDPKKCRIPVVAISAFSDNARRLELFRAGINDYAQKPVLGDELLARVNNLVRTQRLQSELDRQNEKLEQLALVDQLTGLYNRHLLMDAIPKQIARSRRQHYALSLVMIDIDHFKQINDSYGHDAGDKVLVAIAETIKQHTREEDVLGRYGGEEFILLLDSCNPKQAVNKSDSIRLSLESLNPLGIKVTASFGVSGLAEGDDYDSLFKRADEAVYRAKTAGRNCVRIEQLS